MLDAYLNSYLANRNAGAIDLVQGNPDEAIA